MHGEQVLGGKSITPPSDHVAPQLYQLYSTDTVNYYGIPLYRDGNKTCILRAFWRHRNCTAVSTVSTVSPLFKLFLNGNFSLTELMKISFQTQKQVIQLIQLIQLAFTL